MPKRKVRADECTGIQPLGSLDMDSMESDRVTTANPEPATLQAPGRVDPPSAVVESVESVESIDIQSSLTDEDNAWYEEFVTLDNPFTCLLDKAVILYEQNNISGAIDLLRMYLEGPQIDTKHESIAWHRMGCFGGGVVRGTQVSPKTCFEIAVACDKTNYAAWRSLGDLGGGMCGGVKLNAFLCIVVALVQSDFKYAQAWNSLGVEYADVAADAQKSSAYRAKAMDNAIRCFQVALGDMVDSTSAAAMRNLKMEWP